MRQICVLNLKNSCLRNANACLKNTNACPKNANKSHAKYKHIHTCTHTHPYTPTHTHTHTHKHTGGPKYYTKYKHGIQFISFLQTYDRIKANACLLMANNPHKIPNANINFCKRVFKNANTCLKITNARFKITNAC